MFQVTKNKIYVCGIIIKKNKQQRKDTQKNNHSYILSIYILFKKGLKKSNMLILSRLSILLFVKNKNPFLVSCIRTIKL